VTLDSLLDRIRKEPGNNPETEAALRAAYQNYRATPAVARHWKLTTAENGRCQYKGLNQEKIELLTQQGQHSAYIQTAIGPRGILVRTYWRVLTVEPKRVSLANDVGSTYFAIPRYPHELYSAGGPLLRIGTARKVGE
jgi:hypothetical protein